MSQKKEKGNHERRESKVEKYENWGMGSHGSEEGTGGVVMLGPKFASNIIVKGNGEKGKRDDKEKEKERKDDKERYDK